MDLRIGRRLEAERRSESYLYPSVTSMEKCINYINHDLLIKLV